MISTFTPIGIDKTYAAGKAPVGVCESIHNMRIKKTHCEGITPHEIDSLMTHPSPPKKIIYDNRSNLHIVLLKDRVRFLYKDIEGLLRVKDQRIESLAIDMDIMGAAIIVQCEDTIKYIFFEFDETKKEVSCDTIEMPEIIFEVHGNRFSSTIETNDLRKVISDKRKEENMFYGTYIFQAFIRTVDNNIIEASGVKVVSAGFLKLNSSENHSFTFGSLDYYLGVSIGQYPVFEKLKKYGVLKDLVIASTKVVLPYDLNSKDIIPNEYWKDDLFRSNVQYILKEVYPENLELLPADGAYASKAVLTGTMYEDLETKEPITIDYPLGQRMQSNSLKVLDNRLYLTQFKTAPDFKKIDIMQQHYDCVNDSEKDGFLEKMETLAEFKNWRYFATNNEQFKKDYLKYLYEQGKYCFLKESNNWYALCFSNKKNDLAPYTSAPPYNDVLPFSSLRSFVLSDNSVRKSTKVILSIEFTDEKKYEELVDTWYIEKGDCLYSTKEEGAFSKKICAINDNGTNNKKATAAFSSTNSPKISLEDFIRDGMQILNSLIESSYNENGQECTDISFVSINTNFSIPSATEIKKINIYRTDGRPIYSGNEINAINPYTYLAWSISNEEIGISGSLKSYNIRAHKLFIPYAGKFDSVGTNEKPTETSLTTSKDTNRLQVSEFGNPFIFRSKNSYRFGVESNKILAIQPITDKVTDTNYGDFPFYCFTDSGIYMTTRGSNGILVESIFIFSEYKLKNAASVCQTNHGTAFATNEGLYLLTGRDVQEMSIPLKREKLSYIKPNNIQSVFDSDQVLQSIFAGDVFTFYDQYNDEVLFVNTAESENGNNIFVYSFTSNAWYTRNLPSAKFFTKVIGNDKIATVENTMSNNTYLHSIGLKSASCLSVNFLKNRTPIELISMPFTLENFSRIERLVNRIWAKAELALAQETQCGNFRIYGSSNGINYTFLNGYTFKASKEDAPSEYVNQVLRRLSCSCKYYIIQLSGDFSDIVFEGVDMEYQAKFNNKLR